MRTSKLVLIVTLVMASGIACAKTRANTEPVMMPELLPPPPPPRVIERFPLEPLPTVEPSPVESALSTLPARTPEPPPPRPEPVKTDETEPIAPERPAPSAPSLTLKPGPGVQAQTEASIRAFLDKATRDLQRVNYAALNADGRAQYDTASRFRQLAEEALKGANLAYAGKLADKAAQMAAVLVR